MQKMYKYTHEIRSELTFDKLISRCNGNILGISKHFLITRTLLLIAYSTGISLKIVLNFYWKDLLEINSENEIVVKNELLNRKYLIPIHKKIKELILIYYETLEFPDLNSPIFNLEILDDNIRKYYNKSCKSLIEFGVPNYYLYLNGEKYFIKLNFDNFTQIVFGKKVFQVYGYSTFITNKLKQHFELKNNDELFTFLEINSKKDLLFELSNISLTDNKGLLLDKNNKTILNYTKPYFSLRDINFNNGGTFQKFDTFSNYLLGGKLQYWIPIVDSVRILLLISLFNGVRMSLLLDLKWKDILIVNQNERTIEIVKVLEYKNYKIKIGDEVIGKLFTHLMIKMRTYYEGDLYYHKNNIHKFMILPNLDTHIFITNKLNQLTQPSLLRELKNTLKHLKFPHYQKITTKSPLIMYGRKIIEIKGDHKNTINALKAHFNFRTKWELFQFLSIGHNIKKNEYEFKGKVRNTIFDEILYDW